MLIITLLYIKLLVVANLLRICNKWIGIKNNYPTNKGVHAEIRWNLIWLDLHEEGHHRLKKLKLFSVKISIAIIAVKHYWMLCNLLCYVMAIMIMISVVVTEVVWNTYLNNITICSADACLSDKKTDTMKIAEFSRPMTTFCCLLCDASHYTQ